MRLLITNCNTSVAVSSLIATEAERVAAAGTEVLVRTPSWGVSSAEGWFDSFISAASVLALLAKEPDPFDAVVLAGFGEHGREGARELLDVPVVDITEAALALAVPLGRRFAVITSLARTAAQIEASLSSSPLGRQACCGVYAIGSPVLELVADPDATLAALVAVGVRAIADGADVMLLGCAGMSALGPRVTAQLGVPVVDGLAAAVKLAEALVALDLPTSKRAYPTPLAKDRPGWPPSDGDTIDWTSGGPLSDLFTPR